jgi:PTH1 family peptidyl-tRNA hydrolase
MMNPRELRLVVGLGNPGKEYEGTRHNIGFEIVDELVRREGGSWEEDRKWRAQKFRGAGVLFLKPLTYMNLSGEAVRKAADFFKISPQQVLVVYDEMSLPLGRLRLRESGSAAGHNGIRSVMEHLGTDSVPRLRVGIGSSGPGGAVGHVLGRFSPAERELVSAVVVESVKAVHSVWEDGLQVAMNRFNGTKLDVE